MWIYHKLNLQDCATHADCLITFHYPTALPVAILSIVFVVLDLADFDSLWFCVSEALFSSQKIFRISRHIESLDACMEY